MNKLRSLLLIAALFAFAGGSMLTSAQTPEAALGSVTYGVWELVSYDAGDGAVEVPNSSDFTVTFGTEGDVVIGADCNTALGEYTINGEAITVTIGPMSMAFCGDESFSDQFVLSVGAASTITSTESGDLVLTPGQGAAEGAATLTLRQSLIGTVWTWTVFQSSDESEIVPDDPTRYTIEFLKDGTVALGVDCNRGRGVYTRDGSSLTIEVQILTRAMCGEDSLHDEYLRLLGDVVSLTFADGSLHLALMMDAGIMSFEPMQYAPAATPEAG